MVTVGVCTGSEVLKMMVMVSGLLAMGSSGPLEVTATKVAVGAVVSTLTLLGSSGSKPTVPLTVSVAPATVVYVMLHGTGSMSPHSVVTAVVTARHCLARPLCSGAS
jgi:hypothetical protein